MNKNKLKLLIIALALFVVVFNVLFALFLQNKSQPEKQNIKQEQVQILKESFSYKGEEGKDALTLLKEKAEVEQDTSGLVVSINGRKTDVKKEFWAFYVNGEFAPVGPAEYQTKEKDLVEWKVEKIK